MSRIDILDFAISLHDNFSDEIEKKFPDNNYPGADRGNSARELYISFLKPLGPYSLTFGFLEEVTPTEIKEEGLSFFKSDYKTKFPDKVELYERIENGAIFSNDPPFNALKVIQDGERLGGMIGVAFKHANENGEDFHADLAARNIAMLFDPILKDLENKVRSSTKRKSRGFWSFFKN